MKFLLFRKFHNRKLFNKIFLIYSAIIIISLVALSFFISRSITQTLMQKELNSNMQILASVSNYFEQKYLSTLSMTQQLYANNDSFSDLVYFLKYDFDVYISNRLNTFSDSTSNTLPSYQTYINAFLIRDTDIRSVILYSNQKDFFYVFGSERAPKLFEYSTSIKELIDSISDARKRHAPYLFSWGDISADFQHSFSIINSINDPISLEGLGSLIVNYRLDGLRGLLRDYEELKGYILILSNSGDVLFDSSNRYYGTKYPYFSTLNDTSVTKILEEESYVNTIPLSQSGTVVAGIIPVEKVMESASNIQKTLFLITALLILLSLILTYSIIQVFSKRTRVILEGMEQLQKGNLNARIPIGRYEDELNEIAANFNDMCDSLNNYINRVYLSEIKQKNAELLALQSQINPHFLYNTLEAVRMKAVSMGASNVGEMVYILAALFRNSIKGGTFISIAAELEHCNLYLELFRIRYGAQLTFAIDVPEEIKSFAIVKFTLQPIIENYVFHGIRRNADDNIVTLRGAFDGRDILFTICDNGKGISPEKLESLKTMLSQNEHNPIGTIGLPNVNERLRIIYGEGYGLNISSEENVGTTVEIKIPAKRKEELSDYVQSFPC